MNFNAIIKILLSGAATIGCLFNSLPAYSDGYLMAHFTGESPIGEQIYFSTSTDGYNWTDVNDSLPVLVSTLGTGGVRDPSLIRSPDGDTFFLIATDLRIARGGSFSEAKNNGSTNIVIWESNDLVHWSSPRLVDVGGSIPTAGCVWAPEAIWDDSLNAYVVYWSSQTTINGITKLRIFYSTTTDFVDFTPAQLYIDRGGDQYIIDTQIVEYNGPNYRYIRVSGDGQITLEGANSILGSWTTLGNLSDIGYTNGNTEGPMMYQFIDSNQWGLMLDRYASGEGYIPLITDNLEDPSSFSTPSNFDLGASHKRHGSILPITDEEMSRVLNIGNSTEGPINALESYWEDGAYVRHYKFDALVESNVSPIADKQWRIVPSLVGDSSHISIESVNLPGYFLRHYAFNLATEQNDDSTIFAEDASFRIVSGLADSDGSSFQSYNYPDRYISDSNGELLLQPANDATSQAQATFRISTEAGSGFQAGLYKIKSRQFGTYLDTQGDGLVELIDSSSYDDQLWYVFPAGDGYYFIENARSDRFYLDSDSEFVIYNDGYRGDDAQWTLEDAGDGSYRLFNRRDGRGYMYGDASGALRWNQGGTGSETKWIFELQ